MTTSAMNMVQAINGALRLEMRRDDRVVVLGEDVGKAGGVFRVTEGLWEEFGDERVVDTPLSEAGIVGTAIGMALYGLRCRSRRFNSPISSTPPTTKSSANLPSFVGALGGNT